MTIHSESNRLIPPRASTVRAFPGRQAGIFRQAAENRFQVKVAARHVDGQQAAIGQSVQIDVHRLAGDQMERHRIGTEHIEHQQVELARRSVNQRKPGIAQDDLHLARESDKYVKNCGLRAIRSTAGSIS